MKNTHFKKAMSLFLTVLMILSCWVWVPGEHNHASAANDAIKNKYLFAYFTGTSKEGQTIHLAVSEDGYNYTALRNNEPVIIPSKGVGNVRDPYIWYNEQDNYYYILATDLDFTDGGGDYSNNSQSFIIWRSKDLVNWYDETFIDVSAMSHLIGDTRNMSAVWAPQVLWDGSAYVVYFTLACNATSWFDIVYLKTTDLLDPNAYYEFDYILGNGTGNGVDNGYGVIDADIIHNPGDGKYYLFYKTECNNKELGTTNKGTSLKTIHYYVGDTPTGPFRNPGDTKWSNCGFSVFPNYNVSLEGCNSFFDNDGNLIMYVDEFEHTNYYTGKAEAYFHIAKSNGNDFTSWSYPDVNSHNINSLSPRHGSVVKITTEEYNRLLANSYNISSSSFPESETLEDHLVARYFTTSDVKWNDVIGQPNLASSTGITMVNDPSIGYYASFDSTNGGWAEVDFDSLFLKSNGLNYEDGFTITFSAKSFPMGGNNNENNDRIYEIADVFGSRTGTEHYTHYSPGGGGNGSYLGNYNGPVDSGNDWLNDKDGANRDDGCFHDYVISYATGNVMVYVDGELVISRNRFTGVKIDDSWYKTLGSNATMRIGRSGWDEDPLFKGWIQNLCVYDTSMSYYDAKRMNDEFKEDMGWVGEGNYTGTSSVIPTFPNANATQMSTTSNTGKTQSPYTPSAHYGNLLYTAPVTKTPSGAAEKQNPTRADFNSATYTQQGETHVGIFYSPLTVMILDGKNPARMPVMIAGRLNKNNYDVYLSSVYPSNGTSESDNPEIRLEHMWYGWTGTDKYHETVQNPDGTNHQIGHNQATSTNTAWLDASSGWGGSQSDRQVYWYASTLKIDEDNIGFGNSYYKKLDLFWRIKGGGDQTFNVPTATKNNPIYVIDFRPILELREEITEAKYNEVMNNTALCPALREKYASAVNTIRTLDPHNFGFAATPVTATKACAKAIGEAVTTYNGVLSEIARQQSAGTYGHSVAEFEAREATCAENGLTGGQYCSICGEILAEQQVIATLPHTFGEIFTENGVKYKQCSDCGVKLEYKPYEIRYENLFSLNRWIDSLSYNNGNGISGGATLSADAHTGKITINNSNTGEAVTSTSGGTNRDGTWTCYSIPVVGNRTYVLEFTTSGVQGEIHVFKYDKDGNLTGTYGDTPLAGTNGTFNKEFTVNSTTAYLELRFDCNAQGTTTFSNIGIYEKENFDTFGATTEESRLAFYPGDNIKLPHPNAAAGYSFAGWYTGNGVRIENVNQLNNPTTIVYGKWIPAGYDVVYDSIFSFSDWAKSSCNQLYYKDDNSTGTLQRLVKKEGIVTDSEKGTITITNDEDTNNFARTNYWVNNGNVYKTPLKQNTEYILEYTASSDDGAKPSVCLYITGGTAQYPETGNFTRYSTGKHYYRFDSGDNKYLTLRFDNVQHGSTVTFSDIAVYEASFEEKAKTIENREYRRYYPTKMGIGDVFEYTPSCPGFTFETWKADTNGDNIGDLEMRDYDDTSLVKENWRLFSTWKENEYTIKFNSNGGSGSVEDIKTAYTANATLPSSGFTKAGYKLLGWSTLKNATSAQYQLGQSVNRLVGENNGTITLYAVWTASNSRVTFDNIIDFSKWNTTTASNGTFSNVTDNGFTLTCTTGEGTSSSPYFPVVPGRDYKVDIDIEGPAWDVYIFFCDADGKWIDFVDGESNRYSNGTTWDSVFTAPNKSEVVKAQIRVDANGAGTEVDFRNIRVYENGKVADGLTSYHLGQEVTYGSAYGNLPTPTREGYTFNGWVDADGESVDANTVVDFTSDKVLYSTWTANKYTVTFEKADGTTSSAQYNYGTAASAVTKPANTETAKTATNHTIYTWPAIADVTADATYKEIATTADHDWSEWTVTNSSTCTVAGTKVRSCTVCGYEETASVELASHTPGDAATCTEPQKCTVCQAVLEEAKGHTWADATCTAPKTCSVCGATEGTALDHEYTYTPAEAGKHTVGCENCTYTATEACADADGDNNCLCDKCSYEFEHKWDEGVEDPESDCENEGTMTYTCTECGKTRTETVGPDGHKYGDLIEKVPATCTEDGTVAHYQCSVCNKYFDADKNVITTIVIPALNHDYASEFTIDTEATCENKGSKSKHCSRCGAKTEVTEIPATGHDYELTDHKDATCTENGHDTYTCKNDKTHGYTETIKATGHVFGQTVAANAATCIATGNEAYKSCTVCNKFFAAAEEADSTKAKDSADAFKLKIDPNAHSWETEYTVDTKASCDAAGSKSYHCEYCDTINVASVVVIAKREHNLIDNGVAKAATCIATGTMNQKCDRVGTAEYEACTYVTTRVIAIDPNNHVTKTEHNQKDATCLNVGYTAGTYCEDCDKWISGHEEIPAIAHKNKEHHDKIDATCMATGTIEYWSCPDCNKNFSDEACANEVTNLTIEINPNAHSWNEWAQTKAPTCSAKGEDTRTCKHNEEHKETRPVDIVADAHKWETEYTTDVEPGCETTGSKSYHCEYCDAINEASKTDIPATGHDWDEGVVTTEPGCTTKGVKTFTCQNDNSHTKTEDVAALNHIDENNNGYCDRCNTLICDHVGQDTVLKDDKAATCLEDGYTGDKHCKKCDVIVEYGEKIDALGHDWADTTYNFAADGKSCTATRECQRTDCGAKETATAKEITSAEKIAATCTEKGTTTYTATFTETWAAEQTLDVKDITIDADNHTKLNKTDAVEETCEADGNIDYWTCEGCQKIYSDAAAKTEITEAETVVAAKGHDYGAWTYDADGNHKRVCANDG
ncbi:MAG: InlB B-repeat-containing protein, partial [Acutalibacteraceae bacterium]|nr:InlB B-repeat-containing protein [Acutalibacteraceae bacterium]